MKPKASPVWAVAIAWLALSLVFRELATGAPPPGQVVGWGSNVAGEATGVPSPAAYYSTGLVSIAREPLADAVAIAAGRSHALALRSDGTVVGCQPIAWVNFW